MPAVSVFIAYADTYIGGNILKQFRNKPQLFNVHACCWEEAGVQQVERDARDALRYAVHRGGSDGSDSSPAQLPDRDPGQSQGTMPHVEGTATAPESSGDFGATASLSPHLQQTLPSVFWRKDSAEVRHALTQCDWIIVEQRQAQEVFDLLHTLQQSSFDKPKRFVLISNFMTWYATPPLEPPEAEERDGEEEEGEEEEMEEVDAPYPPPPELVEDLNDPSRDADADADEDAGDKEVLTEDQFNRRIPHAKYFNWRDAEKAVAAAHRAKGLPLDTFVIFAGLAYGEGEDVLKPFFSEAWSDSASAQGALPIFGSGKQMIPAVHVRDLATFTRKLLRCSYNDLPNPSGRYLFVTDGAPISWRSMIRCINQMFGGQRSYVTVPTDDYALYSNVELLTIDLRVESETVTAVMEREDPSEEEAFIAAPAVHKDSSGVGSTWAALGGFRANMDKIALEFRSAHGITPLRVAVLGPPMAGKTYLSRRLAAHYQVPHFSLDDIVAAYTARVTELQTKLANYRSTLIDGEKRRRLEIKRRRLLYSVRRTEEGDGGEEDGDDASDDEEPPQRGSARGSGTTPPAAARGGEGDEEREEKEFELTPDEEREAEEVMTEVFEGSELVERWRQTAAEMGRVLLMRVRQRAATPDGNPKKRANQAKKKMTKEQQKRKDEEELQMAKDSLKGAPFQDRAIALMTRWRLAQPDCRNQGFVLDGVPQTVAQARLCFGIEELHAPQTEEEALNPPVDLQAPATAAGEEDEEPAPPKELCSGATLPAHVIVLEADENFLLDRIAALSQGAGSVPHLAAAEVNTHYLDAGGGLERFYEGMAVFRREFLEADFSLIGFFECATTVPGEVTLGGDTPQTHLITVQGSEPLVPPPPPESAYEEASLTSAESAARYFIGEPHNLGRSPLQLYKDELRRQKLREEQRDTEMREADQQTQEERMAFQQESVVRNAREKELLEIKRRDVEEMEKRKEPLREYLMQSIVPLLSKGLVEVCARRPENPVDYLAEWLLRHNPHDDIFTDL